MSSWLQHIDSTTVNEGNLSRRSSAVAAVKFISRIVQGNKKPNHIPNIRSQGLSPQARWVESPGKQPLEQEQRAFETLKYVLRILGYRLLDAETVNVTALAKALDASVVEVKAGAKAFPPESQKLFDSLAGQLDNVALVNGAFVSFYFIGFLVSELFGSLPNYKQNDPSLGPTLLRKLIIAAVGEDAFKENLTANLAALKVLAMTTERLSFTSVSSSIFPGRNQLSILPTATANRSQASPAYNLVATRMKAGEIGIKIKGSIKDSSSISNYGASLNRTQTKALARSRTGNFYQATSTLAHM